MTDQDQIEENADNELNDPDGAHYKWDGEAPEIDF